MNKFSHLEIGDYKRGVGRRLKMVVREINEIDDITKEVEDQVEKAMSKAHFNRKRRDISFDIRLVCFNVLEDMKQKGKIFSYDDALVCRRGLFGDINGSEMYDLEYVLAFMIKDGSLVHRKIQHIDITHPDEKEMVKKDGN